MAGADPGKSLDWLPLQLALPQSTARQMAYNLNLSPEMHHEVENSFSKNFIATNTEKKMT